MLSETHTWLFLLMGSLKNHKIYWVWNCTWANLPKERSADSADVRYFLTGDSEVRKLRPTTATRMGSGSQTHQDHEGPESWADGISRVEVDFDLGNLRQRLWHRHHTAERRRTTCKGWVEAEIMHGWKPTSVPTLAVHPWVQIPQGPDPFWRFHPSPVNAKHIPTRVWGKEEECSHHTYLHEFKKNVIRILKASVWSILEFRDKVDGKENIIFMHCIKICPAGTPRK